MSLLAGLFGQLETRPDAAAKSSPPVPGDSILATPADMAPLSDAESPEPITEGYVIHTAATAPAAWITARDTFINHLMACRACYAQAGRYCTDGANLRHAYNSTPWS
ncbi:hypothetical protein [Ectopseudomonas oleovorans]|uniref:Uncharacterized protein n=1 Tax=Ectopseudomonas oleovorans TaxID=301 RepID=A0A427H8D2_ECTOL|nr:hypothetical protein [Pseudomonas oleovorans]RRW29097.1 hypothetical protein EGJ44_20745 [Pseudomonas oleovorans]